MCQMSLSFELIKNRIKTDENYIPRNYQSVGGMWTVDTWREGVVEYQVMDEGYTSVISSPTVHVMCLWDNNGSKFVFRKGTLEDLFELARVLTFQDETV
jgi:hypothetical protein